MSRKYLPNDRVPVIIFCSPFEWAKEGLSGLPKRGFGLMFLSAVQFTHCTGSRDLL
jgi:hypothetical protein